MAWCDVTFGCEAPETFHEQRVRPASRVVVSGCFLNFHSGLNDLLHRGVWFVL